MNSWSVAVREDVCQKKETATGHGVKPKILIANVVPGRMMPRDKDNPDSYKVRRAKVGGYRDYFTDEEVAVIDRLVADALDPMFRYK